MTSTTSRGGNRSPRACPGCGRNGTQRPHRRNCPHARPPTPRHVATRTITWDAPYFVVRPGIADDIDEVRFTTLAALIHEAGLPTPTTGVRYRIRITPLPGGAP